MATMREQYIITLEPLPQVDGIRALRVALKYLKRRLGLKAIHIEMKKQPAKESGD